MENKKLYSLYKDLNQKELNDEFIEACKTGTLKKIKYLLTSSDLDNHAEIHYQEDNCIALVCNRGYFDIVKYLLTSPELKEHPDIHAQDDYGFCLGMFHGHLDVINFLIFEIGIEKTERINKSLEEPSSGYWGEQIIEQVKDMFKIRDLNESINKELSSKKINHKKIKI